VDVEGKPMITAPPASSAPLAISLKLIPPANVALKTTSPLMMEHALVTPVVKGLNPMPIKQPVFLVMKDSTLLIHTNAYPAL